MKYKQQILYVVVCLFVLFILYIGFIFFTTPLMLMRVKYNELQRQPSPDGRVEAVLVSGNAGATDSGHNWVYIVPVGLDLKKGILKSKYHTPVFHAEYLFDIDMTWEESRSLCIEYNGMNVTKYRDHAYPFEGDDNYKVIVKENSKQMP